MADAQDLGSCVLIGRKGSSPFPGTFLTIMINNFLTSLLGLNIYVYGLSVSLALVAFLFLYWQQLRRTSFNEEKMMDALFVAGLVALIFGRAAYVFYDWQSFSQNLLTPFLLINFPGINEFFFWLGFFGYWWLYAKARKVPFSNLHKLFLVPVISIRLFLSFAALLTNVSWLAVSRPVIYLVLIGFYQLVTRVWKKDWFKQQSFLMLLLYLSVPNFLVDFFQKSRVYFVESIWISNQQVPYLLLLLVVGLLAIIKLFKQNKKKDGH